MSFFDTYVEVSGGSWINSDEKQDMIEKGIPFEITSVQDDDANKYGPRFIAVVEAPNVQTGDVETRNIGFPKGTVESRDRMLLALQKYLAENEGETSGPVKLEKVGNSILVRKA